MGSHLEHLLSLGLLAALVCGESKVSVPNSGSSGSDPSGASGAGATTAGSAGGRSENLPPAGNSSGGNDNGGSAVDATRGGGGGLVALGGGGTTNEPAALGSFFVTSTGSGSDGGDLGGVEGADAKCLTLAEAVGLGNKDWHAYLSTSASEGAPASNARDRIGQGPWYNVKGVLLAQNLDSLHSNLAMFTPAVALDENGAMVPVYESWDPPVFGDHDILTGSNDDGTALSAEQDATCRNWTSQLGRARVGHHDRLGPLDINPSADS